MADFEWTKAREKAAQLIAEGRLGDDEIASEAGVDRRTLWNWRQAPAFAARVGETVEAVRAVLRRRAISHVEQRVARLNRDWLRLQRLIEERADAPEMASVAGGTTGLLAHYRKPVKVGDDVEWVDVYEFDAAVARELREIEKQAAQELGQWTERSSIEDARKSYETANSPETL